MNGFLGTSEQEELFDAAWAVIARWVPRFMRKDEDFAAVIEEFLEIKESFYRKLQEFAETERRIVIPEWPIGRTIYKRGGKGLSELLSEHCFSLQEKARDLADMLIKELFGKRGVSFDREAKEIIIGMLIQAILKTWDGIRLRCGEEPGIAY